MWKALLASPWGSLALVPTDHGISVQPVVDALAVAASERNDGVRCVDARGAEVEEAKRLAKDVSASLAAQERTVVVVDPLVRSLSGVHLVQGVHAVLLVVRVGAMDQEALASTVAILGSDRIIGSVAAPPEP